MRPARKNFPPDFPMYPQRKNYGSMKPFEFSLEKFLNSVRFICVHFVMNHFHHMSILCGRFILSSTGSLVRKLSLITVAMSGEILH